MRQSSASASCIGSGYQHEGNARDGQAAAKFEAKLSAAGKYEVRLAYTPNANRSSKTTVEVQHAKGREVVTVNQQQQPSIDGHFISLGTFEFTANQPAAVVVSNCGADGYVVIDAVQWLPTFR